MNGQSPQPKVLIVDDDSDFLSDLKTWSAREGFQTHAVQLGKAGIQHFHLYRPYAVVILDIHMPKVNGLEVLKEIKQTDCNVKVFVITGDSAAREQAIALGADAFVSKPVGREIVCRLLRRMTGCGN